MVGKVKSEEPSAELKESILNEPMDSTNPTAWYFYWELKAAFFWPLVSGGTCSLTFVIEKVV